MSDQIRNKLNAYLDGELDQRAQSEVQAHLETCPDCREELEELRRLSILLRAAPLPDFVPAHTFKAQLMLQLPRRADAPQQARTNGRALLWLAPLVGLAGWIFVQVTFLLSWLVSLAAQTGILDGAAAWLNPTPGQELWVAAVQAAFSGVISPQLQPGLNFLNETGLFTQNLVLALILQVGVALLYWGALTLVWHFKVKPLWISATAE